MSFEIQLQKVDAGYETPYLKDVTLNFREGEWTFLIGETGSGKSTLLQAIARLNKIFSGDIFFDGKSLKDKKNLKKFRELVGVMFQYTEKQFFCDSVEEEIIYSLKRKFLSENEVKKRLNDIIESLNFPKDILENSPFEISGGEKRFTALASILINNPKILLLDEPTAGLDIENKNLFYTVLRELNKSGVTIIQISHTLEDVLKYGERVIKLKDGKIVKDGRPKEILLEEDSEVMNIFKHLSKVGLDLKGIDSIEKLCEVVLDEKKI